MPRPEPAGWLLTLGLWGEALVGCAHRKIRLKIRLKIRPATAQPGTRAGRGGAAGWVWQGWCAAGGTQLGREPERVPSTKRSHQSGASRHAKVAICAVERTAWWPWWCSICPRQNKRSFRTPYCSREALLVGSAEVSRRDQPSSSVAVTMAGEPQPRPSPPVYPDPNRESYFHASTALVEDWPNTTTTESIQEYCER